MFYIISYDIIDDKRRAKVSKILENYCTRVQYSVFETLLEVDKYEEMISELNKIIDKTEDSIRIYKLCDACSKKVTIYGIGEVLKDKEMYII